MKKFKRILLILVLCLIAAFMIGPKPAEPVFTNTIPEIKANIDEIETVIISREQQEKLKPDNQARIMWANDTLREKTEYCLLYLHGFSGSWYESDPVHINFARRYGCNAYFPRLHAHGLDNEEPLLDFDPEKLWESAKEALSVARILGQKVIIMSTSTGGTLSLKLAAEFPDQVHSLIMFSPNIRLANKASFILSGPWGLQIGRLFFNGRYRITGTDFNSKECQYWYCRYRVEGIVRLQQLLDATMNKETFERVNVPVFAGYYYKDKENQDPTVRVSSILNMFGELGTPDDKKVGMAFPDAGAHVIGCELLSNCSGEVATATFDFAEKVIGMTPIVK